MEYCKISGMDVVAKTGTTDDSYDRWVCGFTPYYAAATWFGYDTNEEVRGFSQNPAGQIWDAVMTDIHKNLENATFTKPSGIVEQTVCRKTGCLATTGCTDTYKEMFASNNLPEKCQGHGSQQICSESGLVATAYCSQYCQVTTNTYGAVVPKEQLSLWTPVGGRKSSSGTRIDGVCTIHTKPKEEEKPVEPVTNTTNTSNTSNTNNTTNTGNTSGGGTTPPTTDPEPPTTDPPDEGNTAPTT